MKYPLLFLIITLTLSTQAQTKSAKQSNFYSAIKKHFNLIDSIRFVDFDLVEAENKKIEQTLNQYKNEIFKLSNVSDYDLLYISKASDNNFCLVSWDTRMGGTMIEFATMAVYKTTNGAVKTKMLIDTSEDPPENTLMHYDTIYSIKTKQGNLYLAHGFGQGSTALPWQELRAFKIVNNRLTNPIVFPKKEHRIFVEFDTHEFGEDERIPTIKVRNTGKEILYPIATSKEGFSGKYQALVFSGTVYKVK